MSQQCLQLTWYNKDMALIPTETDKYGYRWVDPADPRYCETHTLVMDEYVHGKQTPKSDTAFYSERADLEPQTDNLLINGESGDVLETLTRVPELAEKYVGNVKMVYIDPPFNTKQAFSSYEDNLEHSIWLTLMRDRLINLRKLLSDEGTIWVHLDDAEVHRMRCLLDEVFTPACFVTTIDPLPMPCDETLGVPLGDTVHGRIDNRVEFVRGRFYGGWIKSLFVAESFDSYTGEYLLAKLPDTSPNIVWWQRLHTTADAFIYYNPKDRYYPDFVAMDDEGMHWIIEGKEQRGQTDDIVQNKRAAAEVVVHRLLGEDAFVGQTWGYLIAYEDDIKNSDSWNDLKAKAHPSSNA